MPMGPWGPSDSLVALQVTVNTSTVKYNRRKSMIPDGNERYSTAIKDIRRESMIHLLIIIIAIIIIIFIAIILIIIIIRIVIIINIINRVIIITIIISCRDMMMAEPS